jgi:hypothetical protein
MLIFETFHPPYVNNSNFCLADVYRFPAQWVYECSLSLLQILQSNKSVTMLETIQKICKLPMMSEEKH